MTVNQLLSAKLSRDSVRLLCATLLLCLPIGILKANAATLEPSQVLICRVGAPENNLVIDTAVAELKLHLERFFGMKATVSEGISERSADGLRFIVGAGPEGAAPMNEKGRFAITVRGGTVWLWGYDRQVGARGTWDPRNSQKGTLQAVYQFLYEFGGVRWLLPGDENTALKASDAPLALPKSFDKVYSFQFSWARIVNYGSGAGMGNHLWRSMDRVNVGMAHSFQHYWGQLIGFNQYFKEHPEYYSLVKGERTPYPEAVSGKRGMRVKTKGTQVCTSNPAVVEIFARRIIDIYRRTGQEIIEVSPNDGGGFCECDACRALDRPELYTPAEIADLGGPCLSDRVFTFLNAVARKVKAEEPKARLGMNLYSYFAMPPKGVERIEVNIVGSFCVEPAYFNDQDYRKETYERIHRWMGKGLGAMVISWYHGSYYWSQTLHVSPHAIGEFIKEIAGIPGMLGVKTEGTDDFGSNGLDYYVTYALLNDPVRNVDAVIDEFCSLAYGPAGPQMRQFFKMAEDTFMARDSKVWKHYAEVVRWYDDAFFAQAYALIDQAGKAVKDNADPNYLKRINITRNALDHTFNMCDFIKKAAALKAYGMVIELPYLSEKYKSPINVNPKDQVSRDKLITEIAESYSRLADLAKKLGGTTFFQSSVMLTAATAGRWDESIKQFDLMRGNKEVNALSDSYPFQIDPGNKGEAEKWHAYDFKADNWKKIRLDAPWEKQGFGEPAPDGYNGIAWYRIPVRMPLRNKGSKVELYLGAVDESCKIWVNGEKAGEFIFDPVKEPGGWQTPRIIDITDKVDFEKINQIAVRVEDKSGQGGIWKGGFIMFK